MRIIWICILFLVLEMSNYFQKLPCLLFPSDSQKPETSTIALFFQHLIFHLEKQ
uniref:Uncharacterized protein n=1 Tax=Ailuropoda melanoleuca TaxID=9646 RepID=A0A7N5KET0_AILME